MRTKERWVFKRLLIGIVIGGFVFAWQHSAADEIKVAVASNFVNPVTLIAEQFEAEFEHTVTLIPGSTGRHYAQILNGAPFDVFLAADSLKPQRLEQQGFALANSRFTYAVGKLVLWSPVGNYVDTRGDVLDRANFRYLTIANPKVAPYGLAAQQVLQARGHWDALNNGTSDARLIRAENINQAYQFVHSKNAELGFVAYSQIKSLISDRVGSFWLVPQALYTPIEQQAVLLKDNDAARTFLAFLRTDKVQRIIQGYGYDVQ